MAFQCFRTSPLQQQKLLVLAWIITLIICFAPCDGRRHINLHLKATATKDKAQEMLHIPVKPGAHHDISESLANHSGVMSQPLPGNHVAQVAHNDVERSEMQHDDTKRLPAGAESRFSASMSSLVEQTGQTEGSSDVVETQVKAAEVNMNGVTALLVFSSLVALLLCYEGSLYCLKFFTNSLIGKNGRDSLDETDEFDGDVATLLAKANDQAIFSRGKASRGLSKGMPGKAKQSSGRDDARKSHQRSSREEFNSQLRSIADDHHLNLLPWSCTSKSQRTGQVKQLILPSQFTVNSINDEVASFTWVTAREAQSAGLPYACLPMDFSEVDKSHNVSSLALGAFGSNRQDEPISSFLEVIPTPWVPGTLQQVLTAYGVDTSPWQEDKVKQLATELATDQTEFMVNERGDLRRVVDCIVLFIFHPATGRVLTRLNTDQASSAKVTPYIQKQIREKDEEAAQRCISEQLGIRSGAIGLNWEKVKCMDAEVTSDEYPGLTTVDRLRIVSGKLVATDEATLQSLGIDASGPVSARNSGSGSLGKWQSQAFLATWAWKQLDQVPQLAKYRTWLMKAMRSEEASRKMDREATMSTQLHQNRKMMHSMSRSSLSVQQNDKVQVVSAWTQEEVEALLREHQSDAESFGMSLQELSSQASLNSMYFGKLCSNGKLVCVQDFVVLRLISSDGGFVLVQRGGEHDLGYEWLSCMKRLDESPGDAVRRLVRAQLRLMNDIVEFCCAPYDMGYEGEQVLRRTWMMSGYIPEAKMSIVEGNNFWVPVHEEQTD